MCPTGNCIVQCLDDLMISMPRSKPLPTAQSPMECMCLARVHASHSSSKPGMCNQHCSFSPKPPAPAILVNVGPLGSTTLNRSGSAGQWASQLTLLRVLPPLATWHPASLLPTGHALMSTPKYVCLAHHLPVWRTL